MEGGDCLPPVGVPETFRGELGSMRLKVPGVNPRVPRPPLRYGVRIARLVYFGVDRIVAEEEGLSLRTLPTGVSLLCPSAPPPPCRSHFCIICHVHLSLWVLGAVILCLPSLVPVSLDLGEDCWQCRENSGLASQLGLTARARGLASVAQGQGLFGGCIGVQCQHRPEW